MVRVLAGLRGPLVLLPKLRGIVAPTLCAGGLALADKLSADDRCILPLPEIVAKPDVTAVRSSDVLSRYGVGRVGNSIPKAEEEKECCVDVC